MRLEFTIPVKPQSKQRHRTGRGGQHYTPAATRAFENTVLMAAREAMRKAGLSVFEGAVRVDMLLVFDRPKRHPKSWPQGLVARPKRPDRDNLVKAVNDGLKAIWGDDAQVVCGEPFKCYAEEGGKARVEVRIETRDQTGFEADLERGGWV